MLGRTKFPPIGERPYFLTLGSYAFYWFTLEPQPVTAPAAPVQEEQLPILEVDDRWENVFRGAAREALNELLPAYLQRCSWFRRKGLQTEAAMILETIPFGGDRPRLNEPAAEIALVQVEYSEGDPA